MLKNTIKYCCALFLCFITSSWAGDRYEIVTHPSVNEKNISTNTLRTIFSMHMKVWSDGRPIRVYVLADNHPLHQRFSKEKLNVFPYQLRLTWDRLVFSGTGQAPNVVSSNSEMLIEIASTPGAIGYLKDAYINDNVSVLNVR